MGNKNSRKNENDLLSFKIIPSGSGSLPACSRCTGVMPFEGLAPKVRAGSSTALALLILCLEQRILGCQSCARCQELDP